MDHVVGLVLLSPRTGVLNAPNNLGKSDSCQPVYRRTRTLKFWHSKMHRLEKPAQEFAALIYLSWNSKYVNVHVDALKGSEMKARPQEKFMDFALKKRLTRTVFCPAR